MKGPWQPVILWAAAALLTALALAAIFHAQPVLRSDHIMYLTVSGPARTEVNGRLDHKDPDLFTNRGIVLKNSSGQDHVKFGAGGEFSATLGDPFGAVESVTIGEHTYRFPPVPFHVGLLETLTGIGYSQPPGVAVVHRGNLLRDLVLLALAVLTVAAIAAAVKSLTARFKAAPADSI